MFTNTNEAGESVYLQQPIDERYANPVYKTVGNLLGEIANTDAVILDLGCNDGVVNYKEINVPKQNIIGVDLAYDAVSANTSELAIQAEAIELPLRDGQFDAILALDIVEHFPKRYAPAIFEECARVGKPGHRLIVSMPLISAHRLFTVREASGALRHGWPDSGLFDRTHHIFGDARAHKRLFRQNGYRPIRQFETVGMTDAVREIGRGQYIAPTSAPEPDTFGKRLVRHYVDMSSRDTVASRMIGHVLGYQRIYVLERD